MVMTACTCTPAFMLFMPVIMFVIVPVVVTAVANFPTAHAIAVILLFYAHKFPFQIVLFIFSSIPTKFFTSSSERMDAISSDRLM